MSYYPHMKRKTLLTVAVVVTFLCTGSLAAATALSINGLGTAKLVRGSQGQAVLHLQSYLNQISGANLSLDGNFGLGTKAAVQAFQASKGLKPDGIVGAATRAAIVTAEDQTEPQVQPLVLDSYNNSSVIASLGQVMTLTLGNPGDGGYQFNTPIYNSAVLTLTNHVHTPPTDPRIVGDFGKDTWTFTANQRGNTNLQITASQSWEPNAPSTMFSTNIAVQ